MGETLGFIWCDHFPPFFSLAAIPYPFPGADGHPSSRARLPTRLHASVIDPTPMSTAHGLVPTVHIASWSLLDGTPD